MKTRPAKKSDIKPGAVLYNMGKYDRAIKVQEVISVRDAKIEAQRDFKVYYPGGLLFSSEEQPVTDNLGYPYYWWHAHQEIHNGRAIWEIEVNEEIYFLNQILEL